jgi:hypothetical protein
VSSDVKFSTRSNFLFTRLKIWSLSWGVPGWINSSIIGPPAPGDWDDDYGPKTRYFSEDNIHYQVQWLKCLRSEYNVESDYIGIWNERPQGSADYVIMLRRALDDNGFSNVGITIEASWQTFEKKILTNATLNASVAAVSAHYACNATPRSTIAMQAHKKFWAGEDNPDDTGAAGAGGNWSGASCWGRKLNQHWVKVYYTPLSSSCPLIHSLMHSLIHSLMRSLVHSLLR